MEQMIKKTIIGILFTLTAVAVVATIIIPFAEDNSTWMKISLNVGMIGVYILAISAIGAIIAFAVKNIAIDKKQLFRTLTILSAVIVIALMSYLFASSELSETAVKAGTNPTLYKWIGAAVNMTYVAFMGVAIAGVGSFIYGKFKK